jgi:hypothetical protein
MQEHWIAQDNRILRAHVLLPLRAADEQLRAWGYRESPSTNDSPAAAPTYREILASSLELEALLALLEARFNTGY